jgi:thioredoxin 1
MVNITDTSFESEVLKSSQLVLVDFWAPWCGPCRMVAPVLEEIAKEYDKVKIVKINVDENPGLSGQYGIMSIPTMMAFKDGKVVEKIVGALPKPAIIGKISKWIQ